MVMIQLDIVLQLTAACISMQSRVAHTQAGLNSGT